VTLAAGLTHIIPAGVFQPAAIGPWNVLGEFQVCGANMIREFFEEFLDAPEHDGSRGTSVDYTAEPYKKLTEPATKATAKAWCFGVDSTAGAGARS